MTLTQIITAVRDELSEPTAGFWSDTELKRWINRANYDLARAANIASSASSTITTASGTESYSLPSGFGLVETVELIDANDADNYSLMVPLALEERMDGIGEPSGYYIHAGTIYLNPKPDGVYSVRLWYIKAGVTLTADGDTPIIDSQYHDLITLFAVSQAKRKADDPAYTTYLSDYVAGRNGMIEDLRQKGQGNRFSSVIDVDER